MSVMKTLTKCKNCGKKFEAENRELNRGNARFCSISCGTTHSNRQLTKQEYTCLVCNTSFKAIAPAKYCSSACKSKNYRQKQVTEQFSTRALQTLFKNLPCEICGWKEATRDIHHIIPVSKGGKNTLCNIIVVCPNHHRMIHRDLVSQEAIFQALKSRLYHHPDLVCQELDAVSGN